MKNGVKMIKKNILKLVEIYKNNDIGKEQLITDLDISRNLFFQILGEPDHEAIMKLRRKARLKLTIKELLNDNK